jgi:hypothetical protein
MPKMTELAMISATLRAVAQCRGGFWSIAAQVNPAWIAF